MTCLPKCFIILLTVWLNDSFLGVNYVFKNIPMIPSTGWKFYVQVSRHFQGTSSLSRKEDLLCWISPPPQMMEATRCFLGSFVKVVFDTDLCFGHCIPLLCGKWTVGDAVSIKPVKKGQKRAQCLAWVCSSHLLVISKWKFNISWFIKKVSIDLA